MDITLIIHGFFEAIRWLIYARIIISFLPLFMNIDPYHPVIKFVYDFTEPMMAPFRKVIPPVGGFDFSIILLWFILQVAENLIMQMVLKIGLS